VVAQVKEMVWDNGEQFDEGEESRAREGKGATAEAACGVKQERTAERKEKQGDKADHESLEERFGSAKSANSPR
jgi:hypothetical protein